MTDTQKLLLDEKRKILRDFHIPWDNDIEVKFLALCDKYPDGDERLLIDGIIHPLLEAKFFGSDEPQFDAKYYYGMIKKYYPTSDAIYEDTLLNIVGHIGKRKLIDAGLIESCGSICGLKLYAI